MTILILSMPFGMETYQPSERLVRRYDCKLLRIAQHVIHNREDSQDAVQESFIKAHQHLNEFREQSRCSTWLFRIAVSQFLMNVRKRRTTPEWLRRECFVIQMFRLKALARPVKSCTQLCEQFLFYAEVGRCCRVPATILIFHGRA
jgi:DNA-directed RNA polymerase specialized sigma24 family protein